MSNNNNDNGEDEILRKKLKPNPSVEQVLEAVRFHFFGAGVAHRVELVKELDSYDDKNLWITVNGTNYLAKVHNGVESRDLIQHLLTGKGEIRKSAIHLQQSIMGHLNDCGIATNKPQTPVTYLPDPKVYPPITFTPAENDPSIAYTFTPVLELIADELLSESANFVVVPLPVHSIEDSPSDLVLRLLAWVPGRPMSSYPMLPIESLADSGKFLGRLGTALASLPESGALEAARRYHQWDGKNTADLKNFVKYVTDARRRSIVESVIDAFQEKILDSKVGETLFETSLIHADFNDANFLLDENFFVSGVIDFGDSVESWSILDLSVAMAYAMLNAYGKRRRSLAAAAALLRGYHSVKPLKPWERSHLPLLIACRLSCSATLGAYSYSQNPGNEYLLLHATPAWNALELIWGTDPQHRAAISTTLRGLFDRACAVCETDENTGVIDCSDLNVPDPSVPDLLQASRVRTAQQQQVISVGFRSRTDLV